MVCGSATAADVREREGTRVASGRSVETEVDGAFLGGLAERIGVGAGTLVMMGARTHKTVRLSQAREGYCAKFYIHLVPANA